MTRNNKNSFVVSMDTLSKNDRTAEFYKTQFINNVKQLTGMTISQDSFFTRGISQAGAGNAITVGTSGKYDVDWVERLQFICERGLKPVYNLVEDWNEINAALVKYADEKYGLRTQDGVRITMHKDFIKVGHHIITNETLAEILVRSMK